MCSHSSAPYTSCGGTVKHSEGLHVRVLSYRCFHRAFGVRVRCWVNVIVVCPTSPSETCSHEPVCTRYDTFSIPPIIGMTARITSDASVSPRWESHHFRSQISNPRMFVLCGGNLDISQVPGPTREDSVGNSSRVLKTIDPHKLRQEQNAMKWRERPDIVSTASTRFSVVVVESKV